MESSGTLYEGSSVGILASRRISPPVSPDLQTCTTGIIGTAHNLHGHFQLMCFELHSPHVTSV